MEIFSAEEARVLGAMMEKEFTTPEYYPMTVNGITTACNQKTNRDPVVTYSHEDVASVIDDLREKRWVISVSSAEYRSAKFRERLTERLELTKAETAVLTLLLLRGPQTLGELKGRSGRIHTFSALSETEKTVTGLMNREEPLMVRLPRQPGRDYRYMHTLCGEPETAEQPGAAGAQADDRMTLLEEEVKTLREELAELRNEFAQFREQFE